MQDLKVALIQAQIFWENLDANLSHFHEIIFSIQNPIDVIILPEMFTTGFTMHVEAMDSLSSLKVKNWMLDIAQERECLLVGSTIYTEDNVNFFNRCFVAFPDRGLKMYDKNYLFSMAGEDQYYQKGTTKLKIDYKGWKIQPMICYDLRFSELANHAGDVDVLIYVANWPQMRIHHWDILLQARAVENLSFVCAVNRVGEDGNGYPYSGHSQILSPTGDVMQKAIDKEQILIAELRYSYLVETREKLPFLQDKI